MLLLQTSSAPEEQKLQYLPEDTSEESLLATKEVQDYRDAVTDMLNGEETNEALHKYGQAVRKLLGVNGGLQVESSS